jgi:hypothetical protein
MKVAWLGRSREVWFWDRRLAVPLGVQKGT